MIRRFSSLQLQRRVVMERTPNPRTFLFVPKFNTSKFPIPRQFEKSLTATAQSPAVARILDLPGVERVLFFSPHSASVTVSSEVFADVVFQQKIESLLETDSATDLEKDANTDIMSTTDRTSEIVAAIQEVLDFRVKPSVQADGGDVELVDYDANTKRVTVRMRGACVGCPSSEQTLKGSITDTLKFYVPDGVLSVECVGAPSGDSDGQYADGVIRHPHDGNILTMEARSEILNTMPIVSLFATKPVDQRMKEKINFASYLSVKRKSVTPDLMVQIKCEQCGAHKGIEALDSLLLNQPQQTGKAAVMVCPVCVVVLSLVD